jgi:hypothetical protein
MEQASTSPEEWETAIRLYEQMTGLLAVATRSTTSDQKAHASAALLERLDIIEAQASAEAKKKTRMLEIVLKPETKRLLYLQAGNLTLEPYASKRSKIAVCTHHKCGTAFLLKTFNQIKSALNLRMWRKFYEPERADSADWEIVFEQHSRIEDIEQDLKGIHCIRRPESLIYSAAKYHETAEEPWLDIPLDKFDHNIFRFFTEAKTYNIVNDKRIEVDRKTELAKWYVTRDVLPYPFESPYDFNGRTYREMLKSFSSMDEKLIFEMQCYSFGVISDILSFNRDDFYRIKIEDVSYDLHMNELRNAFRYLGFVESDLDICLTSARSNMLGINPNAAGKHGTTGISQEWKDCFSGCVAKKYDSIYKDASKVMGY